MSTIKLTTAQALIRFIKNQYLEIDGTRTNFLQAHWAFLDTGMWLGSDKPFRKTRILNTSWLGMSKRLFILPAVLPK